MLKKKKIQTTMTTAHQLKSSTTPKPIDGNHDKRNQGIRLGFMETMLAEFICAGCLDSMFETCMIVSPDASIGYPDNFEDLTDQIISDKNRLRHITHTEGHGYAFCGYYELTKLWRVWEDPKKTTLLASAALREAELATMSPEIAEKFHTQSLEDSSGFLGALERMLNGERVIYEEEEDKKEVQN